MTCGSVEFIFYRNKKEIIIITLGKSENRFATTLDLCKLIKTLRVEIYYITNVNYRSSISTLMKNVNNEYQSLL